MTAMGHLHPRRVGVAIHSNHFYTKALEFDHHFLAQLAAAEHHHLGAMLG